MAPFCGATTIILGKGYPDVYTRILVKKLNQQLQLPILALFDSDPDGIAIMCVYRFGSEALSCFVNKLATPEIKWLGIHPADIEQFSVTTLPLKERDICKLKNLKKKPFVLANKKILDQVNSMLQSTRKAEIEALDEIAPSFLIDKYICSKILNNQLY